jgi:exosortase K
MRIGNAAVLRNVAENIVGYVLCGAISLAGLAYAQNLSDAALRVVLAPYAKAVEVFYNIEMAYLDGIGYTAPGLSFAIGENCSGLSYMITVFCMMACMFAHRFPMRRKLIWILLQAPVGIGAGMVATCLRIIGSISFAGYPGFPTLHAGVGISFYLAGMIACVWIAERATSRPTKPVNRTAVRNKRNRGREMAADGMAWQRNGGRT